MTDRLMALAAALMLAVTLACGEADNKSPRPSRTPTPNGSITAAGHQRHRHHDGWPGESPGDSMNGGNNETGGAVPGDGDMSVAAARTPAPGIRPGAGGIAEPVHSQPHRRLSGSAADAWRPPRQL